MSSSTKPLLPSTQSLDLTIKPYSIASPECTHLIEALDKEVEVLYPDWRDFPYQGEGDWLNEKMEEMVAAEGKGELVFFLAVVRGKKEEDEEEVVGCVGVRVLPYFPLHRAAAAASSSSNRSTGNVGGADTVLGEEPRTAELKRMYVLPAYRGRKEVDLSTANLYSSSLSSSSSADPTTTTTTTTTTRHCVSSIAALLVQTAETYAREHMGVKRLVLETGMRQVAAMKLYERAGWTKRGEFGDYVGAGEEVGGLSRFKEKWM